MSKERIISLFLRATMELQTDLLTPLLEVIQMRRTVKPGQMNGALIPDEWIQILLEMADWAPTHGRTEPWRFIVLSGQAFESFSKQHAELYRAATPEDKFKSSKYQKLLLNGKRASHLIITVMKRSEPTKIPVEEEFAAVATAVQNMLLGAAALGLAAQWSTGARATKADMKELLQLRPEDKVVSFLYLGFTDKEPRKGLRRVPLEEKVIWKKESF